MKTFAWWFSRLLLLGILIDWVVGIPAIFAPAWTLQLLREPTAPSVTWVAFTSLLLVLLSFFYIPVAGEPYRFPIIARMAVGSRLIQAIFFLWLYPEQYADRGIINLVLFLTQLPSLILMLRRRRGRPLKKTESPTR